MREEEGKREGKREVEGSWKQGGGGMGAHTQSKVRHW